MRTRSAGSCSGILRIDVPNRIKHSVGRQSALFYRGIPYLGQEWSFFERSKHSNGRQSALSNCGIPNRGQEWSFSERSKHSSGRQSTLSNRSMTNLGQKRLFSEQNKHSDGRQSTLFNCGIPNLGQEWSFSERSKHSVGRQSALSNRGIPYLGQEWLFFERSKHSDGRDNACCENKLSRQEIEQSFYIGYFLIINTETQFQIVACPPCAVENMPRLRPISSRFSYNFYKNFSIILSCATFHVLRQRMPKKMMLHSITTASRWMPSTLMVSGESRRT